MRPDQFSPEEGVMLDADLPQLLGSSVIRELEADCTFKLLVLEGRERGETERNVSKVAGDTKPSGLTLFCWGKTQYFCVDWSSGQSNAFMKNSVNPLHLWTPHQGRGRYFVLAYTLLRKRKNTYRKRGFCWPDRKEQMKAGGKDSIQCSDSGSKSEENYFMALYLHSLSLCSGCGCSCSSSVKGALYLAQPQAHCVALSLDWVWPRQPVTLRLSMEDKLQCCTTQWGGSKYSPWPCRGAKLEV